MAGAGWAMRLSLSTRIFLGFAAVVTCFAATALYGAAAVATLRHELGLLRTRALPLLGTLRDHGLELRGFDEALARAAPHDLEWVARFLPNARPFQRLQRIGEQVEALRAGDRPPRLARLLVTGPGPLPAVGVGLDALRRGADSARRIGNDPRLLALLPQATTPTDDAEAFDRLVVGLERAVADKRAADAARLVVEARRIVRRAHGAIGDAESQLQAALQERFTAAEHSERLLVVVVLVSSGLALLASIVVLLWMLATLRPMAALAEVLRRFTAGDRSARAALDGATEIRTLAEETNRMADALQAREQQIATARAELARAEQLATVGQLAARMAHEVRNPLSSIGLNAEMLGDELRAGATGDPAEAAALIAAIGAEIERLRGITERYLKHARPPDDGHRPLDLGELVGRVTDFSATELAQRGVRVRLHIEPDCLVEGQEGPLRSAVWNLLRNAWEAMPEGGEVRVSVAHGPDPAAVDGGNAPSEVILAVEDDGPGIDASARERVFEPFFTTKPAGTGVGLAVVRETARGHAGSVRVEAAPSGGARMVLRLPGWAAGRGRLGAASSGG